MNQTGTATPPGGGSRSGKAPLPFGIRVKQPGRAWWVPSRSESGKDRVVYLSGKEIRCNCPWGLGWQMGKDYCHHIKECEEAGLLTTARIKPPAVVVDPPDDDPFGLPARGALGPLAPIPVEDDPFAGEPVNVAVVTGESPHPPTFAEIVKLEQDWYGFGGTTGKARVA